MESNAENCDKQDHRLTVCEKRLDDHGERLDELTNNHTRIDTVLDRLDHTVAALEQTVAELQLKPAKAADSVGMTIVAAIVSAVIGFIAAHYLG